MNYCRQDPYPYKKKMNPKWFIPKFKFAKYCYKVATSVKCGDIFWFNGMFSCDLMSDLQILVIFETTFAFRETGYHR